MIEKSFIYSLWVAFSICVVLDQEGPGAVWAAETEDGGGGGGTQWVGEDHPVEDPQTGAPQTEQRGQEVHHEPQGHAQNPGKNKQVKKYLLNPADLQLWWLWIDFFTILCAVTQGKLIWI